MARCHQRPRMTQCVASRYVPGAPPPVFAIGLRTAQVGLTIGGFSVLAVAEGAPAVVSWQRRARVATLQRVEPRGKLFLGFGRIVSYGSMEGSLEPDSTVGVFMLLC